MQTELRSPINSAADFEDTPIEQTSNGMNVSEDPFSPMIELASNGTHSIMDFDTGNHNELLSIQEAEQRLFKSNLEKHSQLMCVHEKMVREIVEVKEILTNAVTELRKHNSYMEAIVSCLLRKNDLQTSTVLTSFLPSTFLATVEGTDTFQVSCPTNSEAEGVRATEQTDTCPSYVNIGNDEHNENVTCADNTGVALLEIVQPETLHTAGSIETGTSTRAVSCDSDVLKSATVHSTQKHGNTMNTNECPQTVSGQPAKKSVRKAKNARTAVTARVTRSKRCK